MDFRVADLARIHESYFAIVERAPHLQECWLSIMHQMEHHMSIYIVSQVYFLQN